MSAHVAEKDAPWTWCACGCGVRLPKETDPRVTVYASPNCYARAARDAAHDPGYAERANPYRGGDA